MSQRRGQDFPDCHEEKISQRGARTDSDLESPDAGGVYCVMLIQKLTSRRGMRCAAEKNFVCSLRFVGSLRNHLSMVDPGGSCLKTLRN